MAAVLKTAARKGLGVRVPRPPNLKGLERSSENATSRSVDMRNGWPTGARRLGAGAESLNLRKGSAGTIATAFEVDERQSTQ